MSDYPPQQGVPMSDYSQPPPQQQQQAAPQPGGYVQAAPGTYGAGYKKKDKGYRPGCLAKEKKKINGGSTTLLYSAPISDRRALWMTGMADTCYDPMDPDATHGSFCFSGAICLNKQLVAGTYVHLYEDRLEWNIPTSCCNTIYDNPHVLYLDRDIAEAQTIPSCCRPCCTHNTCAPTSYDAYGEQVMLYGEQDCCFVSGARPWGHAGPPQCCIGRPCPIFNKQWVMIRFLRDAQILKQHIRTARANLVRHGLARPTLAGATVTM